MIGGEGGDIVAGNQGDDRLIGDGGSDHLLGNDVDDRIWARDGFIDDIECHLGNDTVFAADRAGRIRPDCETVNRFWRNR